MIVLGADTHKRSHTIAAVAAGSGEVLGEQTVAVGRRGFASLLRWARALDGQRVWALEDCRHVSGSLERFLIERGERVLRIPTHLAANARRSARQRGKSDAIDALNVARAALQEGLGTFPAAHLDGPELDLRLLVDHRERLVRHRVELNSTLLWHLHDLWPELQLPGGALFSKKWSTRIGRRLARAEQTMRVRIARDELRRLRELTLAVRALDCCTREITGWRLDVRCRASEATAVVDAAVTARQIRPGELTLGTDNGTALTARAFRARLAEHQITHRRGGYRDPESQAFIESWFSKLKERCVWREEFETLDQARETIGAYIDGYHHRPHSGLAYRTPREVAATWKDHDDQLTPAA